MVCVCVCVCVFPFTVKASINVMPEIKSAMACWGNISVCQEPLLLHHIQSCSRDLQASNCAKESQLVREEPREVKDNSYKCSRNQK